MKKTLLLLLITVLASGCSTFNRMFPDRSDEYQRAETMPDLEIPPDLTSGSINNSMAIPNEGQRMPRTAPTRTGSTSAPVPAAGEPSLAIIETINNNKPLLSIPEEFTLAWVDVGEILANAGMTVGDSDQSTGIYRVSYSPDGQAPNRSLFTMIKTWDFSTAGESQDMQVSVTGVGNKTEVIVLDMDGEWLATEASNTLLNTIRDHYNLKKTQ